MTTERSLAGSELPEEVRHRVAEPHGCHHQDKRIAMFKALAVAHHHHVHAAPEPYVKRSAELHHEPREQVVNFDLRISDSDVDCKNHEERHAHNIGHGRQTKIAALGKRPCEGQRKRRGKGEVACIGSLVHFGGHARPFPGANASQEAHQADAAVVAEPQQKENDWNGDKRRNQSLSQVTHAIPSQTFFRGF